jgi:hypothetical protein
MRLSLEALETRENPATFNPVVAQAAFNDLLVNVNAILLSPTPPSATSVGNLVLTTFAAVQDEIVTPAEQGQIFQAATQVVFEANVPVQRLFAIVTDIYIIRASIG